MLALALARCPLLLAGRSRVSVSKYGIQKLADEKLKGFLAALYKYRGGSERMAWFLWLLGLVDNLVDERTFCPEVGLMYSVVLRRAFPDHLKAIAERLNSAAEGELQMRSEHVTRMIIGPDATRSLPETWDCPLLLAVAAPRLIEGLLDQVPRHACLGSLRERAARSVTPRRVLACVRASLSHSIIASQIV